MDNLNYNLLKVFMCVATSNSFLEASKKLYISQPAISKSIKALEDELGVNLFKRGNKGICLTSDGETLLKHVKEAYHLLEVGERKIKEANSINEGILVIGSDELSNPFLFERIKLFRKDYPNVKVKVIHASIDSLDKHEVDALITTSNFSNYKSVYVTSVKTCFIKSKTYDSGSIILPSTNNIIRKKLEIDLKPTLEFDDMNLIKSAVRNDLGIGLVIDEDLSDEFIKTNLNYDLPNIDINVFYNDNYLTKIGALFIDEYILKKDI